MRWDNDNIEPIARRHLHVRPPAKMTHSKATSIPEVLQSLQKTPFGGDSDLSMRIPYCNQDYLLSQKKSPFLCKLSIQEVPQTQSNSMMRYKSDFSVSGNRFLKMYPMSHVGQI